MGLDDTSPWRAFATAMKAFLPLHQLWAHGCVCVYNTITDI